MNLNSLSECLPRPPGHHPEETRNSAPGASQAPTQPGGGLAALRTRTSSGPPAPQLAQPLILGLPDDLLKKIIKPRPGDLGRDLPAVHDTCTAFRKIVAKDADLRFRHMLGRIARWADASADRVSRGDTAELAWHVPLLPLLGPAQRAHLVDCALHRDANDPIHKQVRAIREMAQGAAHLDPSLQARLVNQAIDFARGNDFVEALKGFGTELAHLDENLRRRLIDKATGLEGDAARASAIGVFSTGLEHLAPPLRQTVLAAALHISTLISDAPWQIMASAHLCKGLKYLDAHHRRVLVERAPLGASAIGNMGGSLECLNRDQRDALVKRALSLTDGPYQHYFTHKAICGLGAGLVHLEPQQIDALVTASTTRLPAELGSRSSGRSTAASAIAALGTNLRHLTDAQQDKLFEAATHLHPHIPTAIAGLAAGLASLDLSVRKDQLGGRLVDMTLSLPLDSGRAFAIGALGPMLGHLKQDRHEGLVHAAISLFKEPMRTFSVPVRAMSAGLSAGFGSLHPDLRSKLVATVTLPQSSDEYHQLCCAAEAIAGLGAGLPHLDEAQGKALFAAAARIPNARDRRFRRDIKHIALQGLAAEATKAALKKE